MDLAAARDETTNKLGSALRAARGARSAESISEVLGISRNTLGDYERGARLPEVDFLVNFAQVTGAELGRLLALRLDETGAKDEYILESLMLMARSRPELWRRASAAIAGDGRGSYAVSEADRREEFSDFVLVTRKGLLGSAGPGAENVIIEPKGALAFRRDWLHSKGVSNANRLIVADIEGDSMEPTLFAGDTVLFLEQNEVNVDDIYLFRLDGRLFVKRLQFKSPGAMEIISDNRTRYAPFELSEKEAIAQRFEVKGRFFWRGGDRLQ